MQMLSFEGLENVSLDERLVQCVHNLIQLVSFLEHDLHEIPDVLRQEFR